MAYFEQIKQLSPLGLTDTQISDNLNDFEMLIFNALPWVLDLEEEQQSDLIVFFYKMGRRVQ